MQPEEVREMFEHQYKAAMITELENDVVFFWDKMADITVQKASDEVFEGFKTADPQQYYQATVDFITPHINDEVEYRVTKALEEWPVKKMECWIKGIPYVEEDVFTFVRLAG